MQHWYFDFWLIIQMQKLLTKTWTNGISLTNFDFEDRKSSVPPALFGIWDISGFNFEETESLFSWRFKQNRAFWLKFWSNKSSRWSGEICLCISSHIKKSVHFLIVSAYPISWGHRQINGYASWISSKSRRVSIETLMADVQSTVQKKI